MKKILLLLVAMLATTSVWAEDFITDVMVIGGTQSETNALKASYTAQGWTVIDQDLNQGAGGDYIYLLYKTASDADPDVLYITDFICNTGYQSEMYIFPGIMYYPVAYDGGSHFVETKGNLNSNTDGMPIYLYYAKTYTDDEFHSVRSISFNNTPEGSTSGYDFNWGCEGAPEIYMHADISKGWLFWQGNDTECIITGFDGPKGKITSYTVPTYHDDLKVISVNSFSGFVNLETLNFYYQCFIDVMPSMQECTNFKHVNVLNSDNTLSAADATPFSIKTIPDNAFYGTSIQNIYLNGVTSIGAYAFEGCNLSEVRFGNSDVQIGNRAFSKISSNCHVYYSGSKDDWNPSMYMFSPNLVVGPQSESWLCGWCGGADLTSENYLYWTFDKSTGHVIIKCYDNMWQESPSEQIITSHNWYKPWVKQLTIEHVYKIQNNEFSGYTDLKTVNLTPSVTSIGSNAFNNCSSLTDIYFDGNDAQWNAVTKGTAWKPNAAKAHWHCTVTFNNNGHGTAPAAQNIEWSNKDKATDPGALSAEVYDFTGWYTDAACTNQWDFNNEVPGDMTLYAGWNAQIEPIEVNAGGVTFNMIKVDGNDDISTFYIGECEVTEALWQAVMGSNPSSNQGNLEDNLPVENISWNDCQTFLAKLRQMTKLDFRLPTSAEWMFAAAGGNYTHGYTYSGSNTINEVAWYASNCEQKQTVGTKAPNELGIHDMSGNVYEIIQEATGVYGGGWHAPASRCKVDSYWVADEDFTDDDTGFRLAITNFDEIQTVPGDVDGDGSVTSADITALYTFLLTGDDSNIVNGDQDGDGSITAGDVTTVYSILLGN